MSDEEWLTHCRKQQIIVIDKDGTHEYEVVGYSLSDKAYILAHGEGPTRLTLLIPKTQMESLCRP